MLRYGLTLSVLLYLLLDLSSPFVPGAFTFDESVEATQHAARRTAVVDTVIVSPHWAPIVQRDAHALSRAPASAPVQSLALSGWIVILRETSFGSSDPPPPAEDH